MIHTHISKSLLTISTELGTSTLRGSFRVVINRLGSSLLPTGCEMLNAQDNTAQIATRTGIMVEGLMPQNLCVWYGSFQPLLFRSFRAFFLNLRLINPNDDSCKVSSGCHEHRPFAS